MIPELIGRTHTLVRLNDLTKEDLIKIMTYAEESPVGVYMDLFRADNIELTFDDSAIEMVSEQAFARKLGARSLVSILNKFLSPIRYICLQNGIHSVSLTREKMEWIMAVDFNLNSIATLLLS